MFILLHTLGLFLITALAEIIGCFLVYKWLRQDSAPWLLVPAAVSLAAFAYLLTLHPGPAGRTYAAYGAVYVTAAVFWMWWVEHQTPTFWDILGTAVCIIGMTIIVLGARTA